MMLCVCCLLMLFMTHHAKADDIDQMKCAAGEADGSASLDDSCPSKETSSKCVVDEDTTVLVHELGLRNFESFMENSTFALVLLYDRMNTDSVEHQMARATLETVAEKGIEGRTFSKDISVSFGQLDVRRHPDLRRLYMDDYIMEDFEEMDSHSFMDNDPLFIDSHFSIFYDYNVLSENPARFDDKASHEEKVRMVQTWLFVVIEKVQDYLGTNNDAIPYEMVAHHSLAYKERNERIKAQLRETDNTFNFDEYFADAANPLPNVHEAYTPPVVEADDQGDKFFKYSAVQIDSVSRLTAILTRYLAWCECYEVLWDEERIKRADEQLNYGPLLEQMNVQVKKLLTEGEVPEDIDLRQYFSDMVFGYGRSSKTLERYMEKEIFDKFGRNMTYSDGLDTYQIDLFNRIRELMVAKKKGVREYVSELVKKMHAIMADFHEKITRSYLDYLKSHNQEPMSGEGFAFQHPDVLSMSDPANAELLSDYAEFERRYTAAGKPVVLTDVKMTLHNDTMQFLLDQCGHIAVTGSIRVSRSVGDSSNTDWGGLEDFRLPETLMNEQRLNGPRKARRRITLEQFMSLSQRIESLYLHDFQMRRKCEHFFYKKSPYDTEQFMQLPYVVAGFDLVQKMIHSNCKDPYPVLFVGKKDTNSKIHIDSDETGFLMYLVSGRKRWVTFKNSERPFLCERLTKDSIIPDVLPMNRSVKDNVYFDDKYPLLRHSVDQSGAYEFIQEPGQLVWIPPSMAHAVENLEDTVGLSFNIIPRAGVYRSIHSQIHDGQEFDQLDMMLRYLMFEQQEDQELFAETKHPLYMTLGEFRAQT